MAIKELQKICLRIRERWDVGKIAIVHRIGLCPVEEVQPILYTKLTQVFPTIPRAIPPSGQRYNCYFIGSSARGFRGYAFCDRHLEGKCANLEEGGLRRGGSRLEGKFRVARSSQREAKPGVARKSLAGMPGTSASR